MIHSHNNSHNYVHVHTILFLFLSPPPQPELHYADLDHFTKKKPAAEKESTDLAAAEGAGKSDASMTKPTPIEEVRFEITKIFNHFSPLPF